MSFASEEEAFAAWAREMPNNGIFLVDTYETLAGVRRAIEIGRELERRGRRLLGIRLDSGDLAELSRAARRMLDEAGFTEARIVGSGDLDEDRIRELKRQGAAITVWGVGTNLVTGGGDSALGGVYKLAAIRGEDGQWNDCVKLSDDPEKSSNPGVEQVRRYSRAGRFVRDVIYDERIGIEEAGIESGGVEDDGGEDLLEPVFRGGVCLHEPEDLRSVRERAAAQKDAIGSAVLGNQSDYPVALEPRLAALKRNLADRDAV